MADLSALGTATNNPSAGDTKSQTRENYRSAVWVARRWLWENSDYPEAKRLRLCGRYPVAEASEVYIAQNREGKCSFSGLIRCGSVWACPDCATTKSFERSEKVEHLLERFYNAHHLNRAYFLTLTMRHDRGQSLAEVWDSFSKRRGGGQGGWASMWNSAEVKAARQRFGLTHYLSTTEVTHGANGWHVHRHILLFSEYEKAGPYLKDPDDWTTTQPDEEDFFNPWARWLTANGYKAPTKTRATRLEQIGRAEFKDMARYMSKGGFQREGWKIAKEMTGGALKDGRAQNRTPFQILIDIMNREAAADYCPGLTSDRHLWREWVETSHGRRAMVTSTGLWKAFQFEHTEVVTDPETGEKSTQIVPDALSAFDLSRPMPTARVAISRASYLALCKRFIAGRPGPAALLSAVEREGPSGAVKFCEANGLDPPTILPAPEYAQGVDLQEVIAETQAVDTVPEWFDSTYSPHSPGPSPVKPPHLDGLGRPVRHNPPI